MSDIILETRNLTKHYGGVHALQDANFTLRKGEHVAIMGDNGAGKSTFVRQITGVEQPTRGEIHFDGKPVHFAGPLDAREAGIEAVFQTLALADDLDVSDNLFLGRELTNKFGLVDDARMEAETRKIMARLNPNFKKISEPVSALSGGQRQSVAIARAVYFNAKILIMDEPTAALGVHESKMVADLIKELKAQGLGIFLISHDTREMLELCDRVSVMKNGALIGTEKVGDVTEDDILSMIIMGKARDAA